MGYWGLCILIMTCNIDTKTAADIDICYMNGSELSNNGTFTITDEDGNAVDLSSVELEMQVKWKPEDPLTGAVIVLGTVAGTLVISGALNNTVTMQGVYQVTPRLYYYDLLRKDIPEYIMAGRFNIIDNITRN